MTSTRSENTSKRNRRQTAQGNGCLSGFLIPPLTALCIGLLLAALAGGFNRVPDEIASAANGNGKIAPLFTAEVQYWASDIARWSAAHNIDPNLAATVMQIESCGNPNAYSYAGASGLFQVMPFHFAASEDPFQPETNAFRGLEYLSRSLEEANGDIRLALAGYNGGIGIINQAEAFWPAETLRYVYWGSGIYADAASNERQSDRLDEWLNAGGASLCSRAHQALGLYP